MYLTLFEKYVWYVCTECVCNAYVVCSKAFRGLPDGVPNAKVMCMWCIWRYLKNMYGAFVLSVYVTHMSCVVKRTEVCRMAYQTLVWFTYDVYYVIQRICVLCYNTWPWLWRLLRIIQNVCVTPVTRARLLCSHMIMHVMYEYCKYVLVTS